MNYDPEMTQETVPLLSDLKCHLLYMFPWYVSGWGPQPGQATTTSPSNDSQQDLSLESLRVWPPPSFTECVPPNFSAHLEDSTIFLWKDQPKFLRVSRACITPPLSSTFYTGLNFSSLSRKPAQWTRVLNIKNKFVFSFCSCCPGDGNRWQNQAGV